MDLPQEMTQCLQAACEGCAEARARLITWCRLRPSNSNGWRVPRAMQAKLDWADIIPEALLQLDAKLDAIPDLTPERLIGLLFCIVRRVLQMQRRRFGAGKRDVAREEAWTEATQDGHRCRRAGSGERTPLEAITVREELAQLPAAIERLPEKYRVVVRMHSLEGLPFAAIGERFGITENAATLRHRKALKVLRRYLEAY